MLQQIADLVEFDLTRLSVENVVTDFNHKFTDSILRIDGDLHRISTLTNNAGNLLLSATNHQEKRVFLNKLKTIEKILPKTGLYFSEHGLVYLYRLPLRQWIKSISLGNNYKLKILHAEEGTLPSLNNTVLCADAQYAKETVIYQDKVYLHWLCVGKVVQDTIIVTNRNFIEEIKELWKTQYLVILDAAPLPQKDTNLIVDF